MTRNQNGEVWTIIVAAGSGSRFGKPKQFEQLGAGTVLDRAIDTALVVSAGVVVVLPNERADLPLPEKCRGIVGGATRSGSVRNGLTLVPDTATVICVHDAARPLASTYLYQRVIEGISSGVVGVVPGLTVADTIKEVDQFGRVVGTLPRQTLVAVQTPQAFKADVLRKAHAAGEEGSDDAELVERIGGTVVVISGEPIARKITLPEDLNWARGVVAGTRHGD